MQVIETGFEGLKLIKLKIFKDERGFFIERFNQKTLAENGVQMACVQVNHSFSVQNIVRGLHFQTGPNQAKLVGVTSGAILDVAVDVRSNSPTFGKHFKVKIEDAGTLLYIPAGFAHGFSVLSPEGANLMYFVDSFYSKEGDNGIMYNDEEFGIDWEVANPIVSAKDASLKTFAEYKKNPLF